MPNAQERLPIPSEQELQGWIPSQRFPSDHLSLVFDFAWRDTNPASSNTSQAADSRAVHAQPDAVPGTGAVPESTGNASDMVPNNSSFPAYHSTGVLEHNTDQRASQPASSGPAISSVSRQQQPQHPSVVDSDKHSPSSSIEVHDAQAIDGSHAAQGLVLPADAAHTPAAAAALARGDIVALPTDTLYGLAACANSQEVGSACSHLPLQLLVLPQHQAQLHVQASQMRGEAQWSLWRPVVVWQLQLMLWVP